MPRHPNSPVLLSVLVLVVAGASLVLGGALSRTSSAEDPSRPHSIVYLHVSGEGAQTKAWYDGGPPSGTLVQTALNHFAAQGYRFAAISTSGSASITQVTGTAMPTTTDSQRERYFAVVLER